MEYVSLGFLGGVRRGIDADFFFGGEDRKITMISLYKFT